MDYGTTSYGLWMLSYLFDFEHVPLLITVLAYGSDRMF